MKSSKIGSGCCLFFLILFSNLTFSLHAQTVSCVRIESILVDACSPPGGIEIDNEMLTFRVGPNPLNIANLTMTFGYGQPFMGIITPNSTTTNKVNQFNATIQSCGFIRQPVGGILPANSKVIFFTSTSVSVSANPFSGLNDTIYAIFQNFTFSNDAYFINYAPANTPPAPNAQTTTISFGSGCTNSVTYLRSQLINQSGFNGAQDGATVFFNANGNPTYANSGCNAPFTSFSANWTLPNSGNVCSTSSPVTLNNFITGSPGGTFTGQGVINNVFNPVGLSGTIPITYSVGAANCLQTLTQNITVLPAQNASWTPPSSACQGDVIALNLLLTGNSGGIWSGTGVSSGNLNTTGLSGSINVTYSVGSGACLASSTQSINVVNVGSAAWTAPTTLCSGAASINLTSNVNGVAGGTWSGTGVSASGIFNPNGLNGTIPITYTITNGNCTNSLTQNITVSAQANASWTVPSGICQGSITNLNTYINGTPGGVWSGNGVSGNNLNTTGLSGSIAITYSAGNGACAATLTQNINIVANTSATWAPPAPICNSSNTIDLNSFVSGTTGGIWTGTGVGSTGIFDPSGLSGNINITYTTGSGSCGAISQQAINVIASPGLPTVSGNLNYCSNQNLSLIFANGINGATFKWYNNMDLISSIFTGTSFTPTITQTTTYWVTQEIGTCVSLPATFTIQITPNPAPPSVLPSYFYCVGSPMPSITVNSTGTVNWFDNSNLTTSIFVGNTFQPNNNQILTFYVTESVNGCESAASVVNIDEGNLVDAQISLSNSGILCSGSTVTLTSNQTTGNVWSTAETSQSITVNTAGTYGLSIAGSCNQSNETVNIIMENVNAQFTSSETSGLAPLTVYFTNTSTPAIYTWYLNGVITNSLPQTGYTFTNSGDNVITLIATSINGCSDIYIQTISIGESQVELYVPNSFTPNGDGINDLFQVYGVGIASLSVNIFDRWGNSVMSWSGLEKGWDGKTQNKNAPDGIYVYKISGKDSNQKIINKIGAVNLIND